MTHRQDTDEMLEEIHRKQGASFQRPETLEAGRSVDEFLWKGDPKATPFSAWDSQSLELASFFLSVIAVVLIVVGRDWPEIIGGIVIGTPSGIFAFRFLRNAFRRTTHRSKPR